MHMLTFTSALSFNQKNVATLAFLTKLHNDMVLQVNQPNPDSFSTVQWHYTCPKKAALLSVFVFECIQAAEMQHAISLLCTLRRNGSI